MKNIFLTILLALAGLIMTTSCGREDFDYNNAADVTGQVNLSGMLVGVDVEASTRASVNTDEYIVRISDVATGTVQKQWNYREMPEIVTLKVGNYYVEAFSHDVQPAEFDKPYYHGTKNFTIRENEITNVETVTCKFANIKVTIEYEAELAELLGDDVQVRVQIGEGTLIFAKGEAKAGYFASVSDLNILTAQLSGTVDGEIMTLTKVFSDVKAGEHRAIRYTLQNTDSGNNFEEGGMNVGISIDADCAIFDKDVMVGVDEGVIEDDENGGPVDPENPNAPTIVGVDFDIKEAQHIPDGGKTIVVDINSEIGFKNLFVNIDSETLTSDILEEVGLAAEFDLANPGSLKAGLQGLGFPVEDEVVGAKYIKFDISNFTPLLGIYGAANHKFIITVVDLEGNSSTETLTLISE